MGVARKTANVVLWMLLAAALGLWVAVDVASVLEYVHTGVVPEHAWIRIAI